MDILRINHRPIRQNHLGIVHLDPIWADPRTLIPVQSWKALEYLCPKAQVGHDYKGMFEAVEDRAMIGHPGLIINRFPFQALEISKVYMGSLHSSP